MEIEILIADDDDVFRELVCDILKKQKYKVLQATNGQEALDMFYGHTEVDLVILDIMMPVYDGWEVIEEVRKVSDVPIIMLTALGDTLSEVSGLRAGADDYISKPFEYEVFLARIETLLRNKKKKLQAVSYYGDLMFDSMHHRVVVGKEEIMLNNKEYQLLSYFINNPKIVLSREQIINQVWGFDFDKDLRTLDTHIKTLRAKLLHCGAFIKTVRGYGYRFEVLDNDLEQNRDISYGGKS